MNTPTISVCMPNYNHAHYLEEALGALVAQTCPPLEIIVIDDCSTDESMPILTRIAATHELVTVHRNEHNLGVLETVSRLTSLARGEYILYTAADDKVFPEMLEKCAQLLARYPQAGLCASATIVLDEEGASKGVVRQTIASKAPCYFTAEEVRARLRKYGHDGWFVSGNTVIYKRAAVLEAGGFRKELHAFADGFLMRVIGLQHGICHVPQPLGAWRVLTTSYARSLARDPVAGPAMLDAAANLIEASYTDLFPVGYATELRQRARLNARRAKLAIRHESIHRRFTELGGGRLGTALAAALRWILSRHFDVTNVWLRRQLGLGVTRLVMWRCQETGARVIAGVRLWLLSWRT